MSWYQPIGYQPINAAGGREAFARVQRGTAMPEDYVPASAFLTAGVQRLSTEPGYTELGKTLLKSSWLSEDRDLARRGTRRMLEDL